MKSARQPSMCCTTPYSETSIDMTVPAIDALAVLESLDISTTASVHRGIKRVSDILDNATNRLNAANRIIMRLGCSPQKDEKHAELIAKALVEQAWITGRMYDPQAAIQAAQAKYERILNIMPYCFVNTATEDVPLEDQPEVRIVPKRARKSSDGDVNDKEKAAFDIYTKLKGTLPNNQIAKKIAEELGISQANASYYVTRKFKDK